MLTDLSVHDVVLIDRLGLTFAPGFTVITGETGAGKSMLLDALALATGERADKGLIRAGAERAGASAVFALTPSHPAWLALQDAELDDGLASAEPALAASPMRASDDATPESGAGSPDEQLLILRRVIARDGPSRAFVNDRPVSLGLVRAIAGCLVEVHGQHDGRGLMDPRTHADILDAFAQAEPQRAACADAWRAKSEAEARLEEITRLVEAARADRAFLEDAVARLEALAPGADEEAELAGERRFLQASEAVRADLAQARAALDEDDGFHSRLGAASRALDRAGAGLEGAARATPLREAASALDKVLIELDEARAALDAAEGALVFDPTRLAEVEERLFALRAAARQHHTSVAGLADALIAHRAALALIDGRDGELAGARTAAEAARSAYDAAAEALFAKRQQAAGRLEKRVGQELKPLKLGKAKMRVVFAPKPAGASGAHSVRFEVATNAGSDFGPLDRIASGGELSRFALALKVALAQGGGAHVFIFDEVDQGVGGATADAVGRRLRHLSAGSQVIVVTHSPQVAARADHHLKIEKREARGRASTHVRALSAEERRDEIARMLAGETITDAARAAAATLLDAA